MSSQYQLKVDYKIWGFLATLAPDFDDCARLKCKGGVYIQTRGASLWTTILKTK